VIPNLGGATKINATAALLTLMAGALLSIPATAQETNDTRIGKLSFESGYPSNETLKKLNDEMDFQRGCQANLWGIPAVGLNEWRKAHFDVFKARSGEMLSYLDFAEKLGILTPNYTTPYMPPSSTLRKAGRLSSRSRPG
jgi:hypothetical protein